jgi:N-acyl-D-aspartate/D-glutamate deacylase
MNGDKNFISLGTKFIHMKAKFHFFILMMACLIHSSLFAQIPPAPNRNAGEGPYTQLIIRGATIINGTGAPALGPVDIVIENNRIVKIVTVGAEGAKINPARRPKLAANGKEIDATGMYALPGLIDMHTHIGGVEQGTPAEYVYKLWMAHGITTVRDVSAGNGLSWVLSEKKRSAENKIIAPRIYAYTAFGQGSKKEIITKQDAIDWVDENAKNGADGIKFFGAST